jgi:hypothetical protein
MPSAVLSCPMAQVIVVCIDRMAHLFSNVAYFCPFGSLFSNFCIILSPNMLDYDSIMAIIAFHFSFGITIVFRVKLLTFCFFSPVGSKMN